MKIRTGIKAGNVLDAVLAGVLTEVAIRAINQI